MTLAHPTGDKVDGPLSILASRQHGVVTAGQLGNLGLGRNGISQRVKRGVLHRVHRGVYAVGHAALSRLGEFIAAVLAAGPGAALSHDSCAELFEVRRWPAGKIHVSSPHRRRIAGVRTHCTALGPLDVVVYRGIPVTKVARLLVDLTDVADADEILGVISEAAWRKRLDLDAARAALARANGRHNLRALDEAIARYLAGEKGPKSRSELAFLRLVRANGLPRPLSNAHVEGEEVDAHWPDRRLIVEVDGHGHRRPAQRRDDARRDAKLKAAGWNVLRVAAEEVENAPERVLRSLELVGLRRTKGL
jgi:very-short-patch-repair endonuclease